MRAFAITVGIIFILLVPLFTFIYLTTNSSDVRKGIKIMINTPVHERFSGAPQ